MITPAVDTTQELAAFLRTRRERLNPQDVGLPSRGRPAGPRDCAAKRSPNWPG